MHARKQQRKPPLIKKVIVHFGALIKRRSKVPPELQAAIDACKDMDELKHLLFTCGTLDEQGIAAFDRKIDELEGIY